MLKTLKYEPFITEESPDSSSVLISTYDFSRNINPMVMDTPLSCGTAPK
jgi:hypothetical protein